MSLVTNLQGRLRNTPLAASHGLMPLFEAVINAIHSIDDLNITVDGLITVEIIRDSQKHLHLDGQSEAAANCITGFKITDNGIGFNDENMRSFETLDSEYKISRGCRGVGRLLWLKAFNEVDIDSVFFSNDSYFARKFVFNASAGVKMLDEKKSDIHALKTSVYLKDFEKRYQSTSAKSSESIANSLLEHCLWYFIRDGGSPRIIVRDGEEFINLDDLFRSHMHASASKEQINIKEIIFELTHIKLHASSSKNHGIAYCAANRLVKEENISDRIPGLHGKLHDADGDFIYFCYISSQYLDDRVRSERTGFDLEEKIDGLFSKTEISLQDIRDATLARSRVHLKDYLAVKIIEGKSRVEEFVSSKAPRYRPILSRIPEDSLAVDPNISDKELELVLHKHLTEIERQLLDTGHTIMTPKNGEAITDYQSRLRDYLQTASAIKMSDLASYVTHRKVILDFLGQAIQRNDEGKYAREELIHELIMPMRKTSNELEPDGSNLWLVDERLAFHNYLASDKSISSMPITDSGDRKEPDLLALNICDNPILVSEGKSLPLASIVVIEIKRPMRDDARAGEEKDPIEQALGYLNRIRKEGVKTASGRPIPKSDDIPGYCYVICDLTDSVVSRCEYLDLTATSDHMGYFGFHKQFKAYIEVISFDRLVNAARERNRAFFDKLGLPTT